MYLERLRCFMYLAHEVAVDIDGENLGILHISGLFGRASKVFISFLPRFSCKTQSKGSFDSQQHVFLEVPDIGSLYKHKLPEEGKVWQFL